MKFFATTKNGDFHISNSLWNPLPTFPVFGGQIISQALKSAYDSVNQKVQIHSLHCYFISPGMLDHPINYTLKKFRDGNVANRNVQALQNEKIISNINVSFVNESEKGIEYEKKIEVENVEFMSLNDYIKIYIKNEKICENVLKHIEYLTDCVDIFMGCDSKNRRYIKFLLKERLDEKSDLACFIAFMSDFFLIEPALLVLNENLFSGSIEKFASLDHSLYFHRELNTENIEFLYITECLNISGSRVFCMGQLIDKTGKIIASAYQEGLVKMKNQ